MNLYEIFLVNLSEVIKNPSYNLSVSLALDSSPGRRASGETMDFARTAKASPTRGGGIAKQWRRGCTKDRFLGSREAAWGTTSQSRSRSTAIPLLAFTRHLPRPGESFLVGEPLAKPKTLQGLPKPPLQGEVALRSNDGEVVRRIFLSLRSN